MPTMDGEDEDDGELRDHVYGVSPVLAALRCKRRSFHRLLLQDTLAADKRRDRPALDEIDRISSELAISVVPWDKGSLNSMCNNRPHQGVVLQASPLQFEPLNSLPPVLPGDAPLWLALDEVTDPQNFGALLRSAFFLGVDGVLVSAKNSCPLTPAVSKASAGAMELIQVHAARNLVRTLTEASDSGWQVVGAALQQSVEPAQLDNSKPTVLVLGSEGHGLRTNILRACTDVVRIPRGMAPVAMLDAEAELVDSLNVSVAGGILLYAMLAGRR